MNLWVIKLGRLAHRPAEDMAEIYLKRLRNAEAFVYKELSDKARRRIASADQRVALTQEGKPWSSEGLAERLHQWRSEGNLQSVAFIIGSSYGIPQEVLATCQHSWSLSGATLAGDIAYVVLWEQLYRATTIVDGHPYHHG